jgi:hypothetical protein
MKPKTSWLTRIVISIGAATAEQGSEIAGELVLNKLIAVVSVIAMSFPSGFWYFRGGGQQYIMSRAARFSCYRTPNPSDSNTDVWTVNYHRFGRAKAQPWLYMVREMGDGWETEKRCDELATRLTAFAQNGLQMLDYQPIDPGSDQYMLCGITKRAPESCELLLTLMPGDDPQDTIQRITTGLKTGKGEFQDTTGRTSDGQPITSINVYSLW